MALSPRERIPRKISRIEPLNLGAVVGRVTPCAPGLVNNEGGAHGVTRPTLWFMERENRRQSVGESSMVETVAVRALRLPLPGGEGQGEGEQDIRGRIA